MTMESFIKMASALTNFSHLHSAIKELLYAADAMGVDDSHGYDNQQTYHTMLTIMNDRSDHDMWKSAYHRPDVDEDKSTVYLGDAMKAHYKKQIVNKTSDVSKEITSNLHDNINWYQIAQQMVREWRS